uniref:carboxypeptidase-like regulatory domain-containing protein n=1 Tax=Kaistella sp. TaxID=2782235 RepID=UPI002F93CBA5
MKFTFNILLIFFGLTLISAQQTFKIKGKIIDFHDKVPLKNAVIKIGNYTETSDQNGFFSFSSVKKGKYTISATHPD